jgi:polysaccharide export outer membrane protein
MRISQFIVPIALALTVAGCMREQPVYYMIDPQTGQPVPVVQQYNQGTYQPHAQQAYTQQPYAQRQAYTQQQPYAPQSYGQPPAQTSSRGMFSSPQAAQQAYAPQYPQSAPVSQPVPPPQDAAPSGRGLLNERRTVPPLQSTQPDPPRTFLLQYHPPQAQGDRYAAAPYGYAYAPGNAEPSYTLDSGDKLRIVVFGQEGISGTYLVDAGGNVSLPLVGTVPARGATTQRLAQLVSERLKQGYVREPHVTVTIDTYRPFFILGEVTTPGQYPYVPNMTVEKAVAVAGGFSPRANKNQVELTRNSGGQHFSNDVPMTYPMRPGDTVVVKERWF